MVRNSRQLRLHAPGLMVMRCNKLRLSTFGLGPQHLREEALHGQHCCPHASTAYFVWPSPPAEDSVRRGAVWLSHSASNPPWKRPLRA